MDDTLKSDTPFSFELPETPIEPLTSKKIEQEILEIQAPKKRGRKPGSTNKKEKEDSSVVSEQIKVMFGPLVVGAHNMICKLLKLTSLDKEQEKMVSESWSMLLQKRAPEFLEKHGDIVAALGGTAMVFAVKLSSETKIFEFGKAKEKPIDNGQT